MYHALLHSVERSFLSSGAFASDENKSQYAPKEHHSSCCWWVFGLWDQSGSSPVWRPRKHIAWMLSPQHQPFTLQAHPCHAQPLAAPGLATDVWWRRGQWYVRKTFPGFNQLWNGYFFNSLISLLLLNCNTRQKDLIFAGCTPQLAFTVFIPHHLFFTFFKGNLCRLFSLFSRERFHVSFLVPVTFLWTLSCFGAGFLWNLGVLGDQSCIWYSKCECIVDLHY